MKAKHSRVPKGLPAGLAFAFLLPAVALLSAQDWPEWRGPARTGVSTEKGLPTSWSPDGENLAWKAPFGGRSAPVVFGDHLYLQNATGSGPTLQERVMCLNADTGKVLWERKYNIFTSDVPTHRIAWASPAVDPATGNVVAISANGVVRSFSKDGQPLWERSLTEEMGMWTTHGGRMSSPIIDGEQVIVSGLTFAWGEYSGGAHRFIAIDKSTGQILWVSAPEGRPTDTIYANAFVADVNGTRMMFSGGSDGAMHGIKIATGEGIWNWRVSQRGLNTAALLVGPDVIVSHSEENLGTSEMGMVAAVPADSKGTLTDKDARWIVRNVQAGYASPVSDGQRLYIVDNGAVLLAFDVKTGARLWEEKLGTIAKASPILADGKLYIGTENTGDAGGKFFIIRPHADRAEILDQDWLGTSEKSEAITASPIAARGRIYVTSMDAVYAIGPRGTGSAGSGGATGSQGSSGSQGSTGSTGSTGSQASTGTSGTAASAQAGTTTSVIVSPTELILEPGESIELSARAFDEKGRAVGNAPQASWTLDGLKGTVKNGTFTPDPAAGAQAGTVKAAVGTVTGASRIRVIPELPWTIDFENAGAVAPPHWVNATGKFAVRDLEGSKVLVKLSENPFAFAKRTRPFLGPPDLSNYTIEADIRAMERRRQMGDFGVVAQRYELVMFGTHQRLELQPWQPETQRTVRVPFTWVKDAWYTMKLEVQALDGGKVRARGKVWPKGEAEPAAWTIERVDPIGNLEGSPGLYADAPSQAGGGSEIYYDNIKVYKNK